MSVLGGEDTRTARQTGNESTPNVPSSGNQDLKFGLQDVSYVLMDGWEQGLGGNSGHARLTLPSRVSLSPVP